MGRRRRWALPCWLSRSPSTAAPSRTTAAGCGPSRRRTVARWVLCATMRRGVGHDGVSTPPARANLPRRGRFGSPSVPSRPHPFPTFPRSPSRSASRCVADHLAARGSGPRYLLRRGRRRGEPQEAGVCCPPFSCFPAVALALRLHWGGLGFFLAAISQQGALQGALPRAISRVLAVRAPSGPRAARRCRIEAAAGSRGGSLPLSVCAGGRTSTPAQWP